MIVEFFITVGIICGIAVFLAGLMVIAERTIGNYGEVKMTINDDKELQIEGGKTLLNSLMEEEIFIPSACGGRGSCGFCKVKVKEGAGEILPTELPWLSEEEKKEGVRLSCQCKVKKDIKLEIDEELFNVKQYLAEVGSIKDLTHDIKEVTFKLPGEINFKAGQFIQFEVPEYDLCEEGVFRAYSISSQPSRKNEVELEIRYVPNGICTTYVHKHLKEGEKIKINGPYGDFFLQDTESDIICIAGGSGMAPIKSILHDMKEKGNQRKVTYFFGARGTRDIFLVEELKQLEKEMPNFTFVPALSGATPEENWTGETGLITDVVDRYIKGKVSEGTEAYLCGSPGMIDACVAVLTANGVKEEKVYYDKFA